MYFYYLSKKHWLYALPLFHQRWVPAQRRSDGGLPNFGSRRIKFLILFGRKEAGAISRGFNECGSPPSPLVTSGLLDRWDRRPSVRSACYRDFELIGTRLRDWAIGQAGGGCYSWAALSSNDSKTRYVGYESGKRASLYTSKCFLFVITLWWI